MVRALMITLSEGVEAEILVCRSCIAIRAAVFTATVRVQAVAKADVGTVILTDDRTGTVGQELGPHVAIGKRPVGEFSTIVGIRFRMDRLKPVQRT